jgi:hypothetical protein
MNTTMKKNESQRERLHEILNELWYLLKTKSKNILLDVFRDFGAPGVLTYVGGVILLYRFPKETDQNKLIVYAVCGVSLLTLATIISYLRIKAQREREKLLIEMAQNSCNRLAEQLGKGLSDRQIDVISQKIRQLQRDMRDTIFNQPIEK